MFVWNYRESGRKREREKDRVSERESESKRVNGYGY